MSAANVFSYLGFSGLNGPGLSGPHLDYLGWLPGNRLYWFGRWLFGFINQLFRSTEADLVTKFHLRFSDNKEPRQRLLLSSISVPHSTTTSWLLIMLPYSTSSVNMYYSLELRCTFYLDTGISRGSSLNKLYFECFSRQNIKFRPASWSNLCRFRTQGSV